MKWLIIVSVFLCVPTQCLIVGSDGAAFIQATIDFLAVDSDNEMRGFTAFDNGFTLENASTSCLYNSLMPLSGFFLLNNGTLNLNDNLLLSSNAYFGNPGTINGFGHTLDMPHTATFLLTQNFVLTPGETALAFLDDVSVGAVVNSVDWSYDNNYVVVALELNSGHELRVYSFDGTNLTFEGSTSLVTSGNSVRWHPSDYYFVCGVDDEGYDIFVYHFDTGTGNVSKTGQAYLTGTGKAVSWSPSGSYIAASSTDNAEEVEVFSFSGGGMSTAAVYNLSPSRDMNQNAIGWDSTSSYIATGFENYSGEPEIIVFHFNGSTITFNASSDSGASATAISYSPTKSWIAVGLAGGSQRLRIYDHNSGAGTLTEKTAARVGESITVRSVHWSPDGNYLLVGRDAGSGTELRVYEVDQTTAALTLVDDVNSVYNLLTARWSHDQDYVVAGGTDNKISVYSFSASAGFYSQGPVTQDPVIFKDLTVRFNSRIIPTNPVKCQGECIIDGKGHVLDLSGTTSLAVDSGASLLLRNVIVKGVSAGALVCLDSNGTLSLEDVTLLLDSDYSFTQGTLEILDDVTVTGPHIFTYKSSNVSTIKENATLFFDSGMTFKYDPPTTVKNLLAMEDATSVLHLYETALHSTTTGLQLTQGTLVVEGVCPVVSDATVQAEAIILGDGVSASNNVCLRILGESGLRVDSGFLEYKNV